MKKPKSSKKISKLCQRLRSDFENWEKIPSEVKSDDKQKREILYTEIKKKIENLTD